MNRQGVLLATPLREVSASRAARGRLPAAITLSMLLHLGLIGHFAWRAAGSAGVSRPGLTVTLMSVPAEDVTAPPAAAVAPAASEGLAAQQAPAPPLVRQHKKIGRVPVRVAATPIAAAAQPASTAQELASQPEPGTPGGMPAPGRGGWVSRATISFDVYAGKDRQFISRGRHLYVAGGEDFGIRVSHEPGAATSIAGEAWEIEIVGRIRDQALSPFLYQTKGAFAQQLVTGREASPGERRWRNPDGILDRQTLLYHFVLRPPDFTGGRVLIADGDAFTSFTYRFAGTESVLLASGPVEAIKFLFSTAKSAETLELWVAPDARFLPVQLRHTDRQGRITEQVTTALEFE